MNLKELAMELDMEEDEIHELLKIFIESSESDLDRLQKAVDKGDHKQVANSAHSIKGASANLGFMDIFSVAKSIERKARDKSLDDVSDEVLIIKDRVSVIAKSINDR